MVNKVVLKPKCRLCVTWQQTNKQKRFPGEKVGKREAKPGKRGRGEAREYRGGGGGGGRG